ncbi:MAG TPA: hypothetical protein ENK91_07460, partial [Bacteroidetes bacterium]|nr:hypothetical protein [Bacteroidota bacterium]
MKKTNLFLLVVMLFVTVTAIAQPGSDLKNPEPGKCYAKCLIPAKYETVSVPVTIKEASMRVNFTPASFTNESEQIMTQEGTKAYSAVAA